MNLEKIRILILQFDLGNPRRNQKLFFQDANFSPAALTTKDQQQFQTTKSEEMWQVLQIINNSFSDINSCYQTADLIFLSKLVFSQNISDYVSCGNFSCHAFISVYFFPSSRDRQYDIFYYFYRILSKWCWIHTKVFIGFSIPSACTQKFPGISRINFGADE